MRLAPLLLALGCGDEKDGFKSFDAGIPEDGGPWQPGEVLTCGHDPLPWYQDGATRWDRADSFDGRFSLGQYWVVPPGAEEVWTVPDLADGYLDAAGDDDLVGHAVRTNAEWGDSGNDTVVGIDVVPVVAGVDSAAVFCRMTATDPPEHFYAAEIQSDRFVLLEDGEVKVERSHDGWSVGRTFRVILVCMDRSEDTLVSAFLYQGTPGALERVGCIWTIDGSPPAPGVAAVGIAGGAAQFDDFRLSLP